MNEYSGDDRRKEQSALIKEVAHQTAQEAVSETLEKLGIDLENHLEMQEDFAWMRKWRKMSEKVGSRVLMTFITIITAGLATLVWTQISGNK